jgi:tetrapyrrole methylase family protein/MazG family protein
MSLPEQAGAEFSRLVEIMARLRAPDGCPWDREQNFDSIKKYTLEETYEVLDAIDDRDWKGLEEELGDYILQAVFYAQMASEENLFDAAGPLRAINEKLIRRHPHVFGDGSAKTADDVKQKWDEIKAGEKQERKRVLDGIPRSQPALSEASQIASKAAGVGFDWDRIEQVYEKLEEEVAELKNTSTQDEREDELGDLLFVAVNLARFLKVDPEQALRKANAKFRRRFNSVEDQMKEAGKDWKESNIEEMESFWQNAKQKQAAGE